MIKKWLLHPLTREMDPDDPLTTVLRREIIKNKPFLRQIYKEWYSDLLAVIPSKDICDGLVLELGSGGGFLKSMLPECITSEVFACPGVDRVLDARSLPFGDQSLRTILMIDVFHHIPDVMLFLSEAQRTLRKDGVIALWEPWNTPWSRFVYQKWHSEPFLPDVKEWAFPSSGPLSSANGALPWIVFERDRHIFEKNFPFLSIEKIKLDFPLAYLASGGISMRSLCPAIFYNLFRKLEKLFLSFRMPIAMFSFILIRRI